MSREEGLLSCSATTLHEDQSFHALSYHISKLHIRRSFVLNRKLGNKTTKFEPSKFFKKFLNNRGQNA